ncbi:NAD(P)H-dependent oxidoreductase [Saprospira grandis]|uniref:NAD(P)H-dependent oxidoreductase n=1 Tax=Saprospira grandis TaxID=1008 RepID=UPI0022DE3F67|nr:NAD(P)H-dependent oxidoreductase [Saprospira grandis]WBM74129.1 NAD(P)H-dependent oxidoreductase [Saprospira grandis]
MKNVLIINAHQPYPFSEGRLNASFCEMAASFFSEKGYQLKFSKTAEQYEVEEEIEKHLWADIVFLQSPINWMGMPWSFKKYMDDVYTAGMMGKLCNNDGRTAAEPKKNYGTGGNLSESKYMISVSFNAPKEAFDNQEEYLFQGKSVDDLLLPQHANFRFFGMKGLPTFASFDVMKNPTIEDDFKRFQKHLESYI